MKAALFSNALSNPYSNIIQNYASKSKYGKWYRRMHYEELLFFVFDYVVFGFAMNI